MSKYFSNFRKKVGNFFKFDEFIPEIVFTEEDFQDDQHGKLLGEYGEQDVKELFEAYSLKKTIESQGFHDLKVKIDSSDPFVHSLRVSDSSIEHLSQESNFLVLLFVRRRDYEVTDFKTLKRFGVEKDLIGTHPHVIDFMKRKLQFKMRISVMEWLSMQNPTVTFSSDRPQLPGQRHPGLRIGRKMLKLLTDLCEKKGRDALLNVPEYFHNAYLYALKHCLFINPEFEAYFASLLDDLQSDIEEKGLAAVSWAIAIGCCKDLKRNITFKWEPQEQCFPTTPRMKEYFQSPEYQQIFQEFRTKGRFKIEWENADEAVKYALHHEIS